MEGSHVAFINSIVALDLCNEQQKIYCSQSLILLDVNLLWSPSTSFLIKETKMGTEACRSVLIPDKKYTAVTLYQKIAIYSFMTEDRFNEAKKQFKGEVTFPIGDIPVSPKMDWQQFDSERRKFLSEYRFDSTTQSENEVYESFLSELAVDAYKACLAAQREVGAVLRIARGSPTQSLVQVIVSFNTATGDTTLRRFRSDYVNAKISDLSKKLLDQEYRGATEFNIWFERDIDKSSVFQVNVSNSGLAGHAELFMPQRPRILRNIPERRSATIAVSANVNKPFSTATIQPEKDFKFDVKAGLSAPAVTISGTVDDYLPQTTHFDENSCSVQANCSAHGGLDGGITARWFLWEIKDPTWIDVTDRSDIRN